MQHAPIGTPCFCGFSGWMQGIEHQDILWGHPQWILERWEKMQAVVIVDHIMQGYLRTMVQWAVDGGSKVIAHFAISPTRTVQFLSVNTPGIHATSWDRPSARRVKERADQAGWGAALYSIGIEHEGASVDPRPSYTLPDAMIYSPQNPWPEDMVQRSIEVKRFCFQSVPTLGVPSRDSIIGHYEIDAGSRANDPESPADRAAGVWPVDRMIRELAPVPTPETRQIYIVQRGDTASAISRRFGLTVAKLVQLNSLSDPARIEVGQILRLTDDAPMPAVKPDDAPDGVMLHLTGPEGGFTPSGDQGTRWVSSNDAYHVFGRTGYTVNGVPVEVYIDIPR